eukprot:TRINITY_DN66617_c4_g2_i2.p1 TRINITY_DN66617_c4_g2~~TRINITY_DN66617_c4_g2_i2.p1  ORF type:complete len:576 (+),score=85.48 TRINITY_DN66617_c4_g2_i2:152-1729(+)
MPAPAAQAPVSALPVQQSIIQPLNANVTQTPPKASSVPRKKPEPSSTSDSPSAASGGSGGAKTEWVTYKTPEGKVYYYHPPTKTTQWNKPKELLEQEKAAQPKQIWKEYTTPEGKKYYYDPVSKTTTWKRPDDMDKLEKKQQQAEDESKKHLPKIGATETITLPSAKSSALSQATVIYTTKKERLNAFKDLLEAKIKDPDIKWEEAMKLIITDERYKALKSMGEKRGTFTDWCDKKRKQLREQAIISKRKARDSFLEMLGEIPELTIHTSFKRAVPLIENDERYAAIPEDSRGKLYEEFMIQLEKIEREALKKARRANMEAFKQQLQETKAISSQSRWVKITELLDHDERYKALDKVDRVIVFEDYIRELERKEEEEKLRAKEDKRKQERKVRDQFRQTLKDHCTQAILSFRTRWSSYLAKNESNEHVAAMLQQSETGAKDIFADFIVELENQWKDDKPILKTIMEEVEVEVTLGTTVEQFTDALKSHKDAETVSPYSVTAMLLELQDKIKEKEREATKAKQKNV